jgi:MFS family permease
VFYNVAVQNLIGILSSSETRTRNYTNLTLVISTAGMLGPLVAGFSIDHFGYVATYLYIAGVPLISVLTVAVFARDLKRPDACESAAGAPAVDGKSLFAIAPLRRILIIGSIVSTGHDLFQFYMPIYGHASGLSASAIGVIMSCFSVAAFAVRVVMPYMIKRWGEQAVLMYSVFLGAVAYLLFPLFASAPLLASVAFLLGLSMGCCAPIALTLIYAYAPASRSGEALGLRLTLNNFTHMAVPLTFGALGTVLGVAPVFIANSVMLAGGGMLVLRRNKKA